MTGKNNNIPKTKSPISYELAQRFIADFSFLREFQDDYSDICNNFPSSPVFNHVLAVASASLLESSGMVLDALFRAYPAEFLGYASDSLEPDRPLTKKEINLARFYLENK